MAASVLDLIRSHFKYALDALPPEKGTIAGPIPTIATNEKDLLSFLAGPQKDANGNILPISEQPIEFGAGQVILVRTLEQVDALCKKLNARENGYTLVLTIEQAKGFILFYHD